MLLFITDTLFHLAFKVGEHKMQTSSVFFIPKYNLCLPLVRCVVSDTPVINPLICPVSIEFLDAQYEITKMPFLRLMTLCNTSLIQSRDPIDLSGHYKHSELQIKSLLCLVSTLMSGIHKLNCCCKWFVWSYAGALLEREVLFCRATSSYLTEAFFPPLYSLSIHEIVFNF